MFTTDAPLTVAGAAPLKMTANGSRSRVYVSGHPMTFNNKTVTLQARGATDHEVRVSYYGAITGSQGITFNTTGAVAIDANGLMNTGDTTVAGGNVSIYGDKMTFNATTHTFSANGPPAGNGDSGTVFVGSSFITLSPTSKVTVTADAATAGTGNSILGDTTTSDPKAIEFYPGSTIDIGKAVGQYSFSAKGGSAGGHGGTVVISALGATLKTASAIDASARAGNSDGGEIRFYNYIDSIDPSATVSAIGKGSGKGGKFTAYHTIIDIDILKYVKVDGGTTVPTTQLNGSIRLNGIWCRQWKLSGSQSWPKTHWVCTNQTDNPSAPAALSVDTAAADVAKSAAFNNATLRALLGNAAHKAHIFVFADNTQFNSFWWEGLPAATGGLTFRIPAASTNIYVNPWQSGTIGGSSSGSYNYPQAKEVAAHEFGHAVDIANGLLSKTTYGTYVLRDLFDLNKVQDTSQPGTVFISRLPCAPTPFLNGGASTGNPPFLNVTDIGTNQPVCIQNLMTGQWELNSFGFPGNPNNIQILQAIEGGLWNPAGQVPPTAPFVEAHAQAFGYQVTGNLGARPMNDKVIDNAKPLNKYMGCVQAWAAAELIGLTSPAVTPTTPSGSCGTAP
ncbi:MAG: hypothetical protein C0508_21485 [Cyanobacteria bacterium PR.023]|nr:hypothetical protein [Cyanobacteria bacterium PR.023]